MAIVPLDKQTAYSRIQSYEAGLSRRFGLTRTQRYDRSWRYYSGSNMPQDDLSVMPLGLNLVKVICDKQSGYVWGQWQEQVIKLRVLPENENSSQEIEACNTASDYLEKVLFKYSEGNKVLRRASLNGAIMGDSVLKISWDPFSNKGKGAPVITSIRPEYVHFRWDPHNDDVLTEVIVAYEIDRNDALRLYKTPGNMTWQVLIKDDSDKGFATYWERWTATEFEVYIDDIKIKELSGPNPYAKTIGDTTYGVIPFVHVKNIEGDDCYGFSDSDPIMMAQDELNRKLSDEGDTITNHAHPIILVRKYFNGDVDELPVGPDQVWDMGREGEAEYLEWDGPQPETHKYLEMIMNLIHDVAGIPPAAFGRAEQSQLSGIAAQMAMLPLTERASDKRIQWTSAFRSVVRIIGWILTVKGAPAGVDPNLLLENTVQPQWSPVLPKDREAEVDENIALFQGGLKLLEDALEDLGMSDPNRKAKLIIKQQEELVQKGILKRTGPAGGGAQTGINPSKSPNTASNPSK